MPSSPSPHYVALGPLLSWTCWLTEFEAPAEQVVAPTSADAARKLYHRLRCAGEAEITVLSERSGVGRIYRVGEVGHRHMSTHSARRAA